MTNTSAVPVETQSWKSPAYEKRAQQWESIPREWRLKNIPASDDVKNAVDYIRSCGILTAAEIEITETVDANTLLLMIASGKLSSFQVTQAFSKRAALAQQLTGCCTEIFFEEGLRRAKELDRYLAETGRVKGPLHGLPIALKDHYNIKGHDTTNGKYQSPSCWLALIGIPAKSNSPLVDVMESLGCVFYVKTNIPQSSMMCDSYNHVFGQCVNALNRGIICGGSSGGTGALVGSRGSIIGIGSDIGGSIRIPSTMQGLYGLSPSVGRVPFEYAGKRGYIVPPVAGPMATSISSVETYMSALIGAQPWLIDPFVLPIPWRTERAMCPTRPLKIGYYRDDGVVKPHPPVERALSQVIGLLQASGHTVLEWDTTSHAHAYDLWLKAVQSDGGGKFRQLCEMGGEPLIEGMIVGKPENELSVEEGEELAAEILEYKTRYLQRWTESGIDALIVPVQSFVGMRPGEWVKNDQYVGYTAHWNLVDYASITLPVTTVDPSLDGTREADEDHIPRNKCEANHRRIYDPALLQGLPVGVQIVGGRFEEEKVVGIAKLLEKLMH